MKIHFGNANKRQTDRIVSVSVDKVSSKSRLLFLKQTQQYNLKLT